MNIEKFPAISNDKKYSDFWNIQTLPPSGMIRVGGLLYKNGLEQEILTNVVIRWLNGIIVDIRSFMSGDKNETHIIDASDFFLLPAMVNAHLHLDLSYLAGKIAPNIGMTGFIRQVVQAKKEQNVLAENEKQKAKEININSEQIELIHILKYLIQEGSLVIEDVANILSHFPILLNSPLEGIIFYEIMGLVPEAADEIFNTSLEQCQKIKKSISEGNPHYHNWQILLSPHSPYSLSAKLQKKISDFILQQKSDLKCSGSIHIAESIAEKKFLSSEKEDFFSLFQDFLEPIIKGTESEKFLPPLTWQQAIDQWLIPNMLWVHGVQLSEKEIAMAAQKNISLVLCPRSNRFIGNAPENGNLFYRKLKKQGMNIALGTDSLASNHNLSMRQEVNAAVQEYGISFTEAFQMATVNGAKALGRNDLGAIDMNKTVKWLSVSMADLPEDMMNNKKNISIEKRVENLLQYIFSSAINFTKPFLLVK